MALPNRSNTTTSIEQCAYMGSSSVLVLIGSHSLCNSFVVNQFLFFTPNGENSLCYMSVYNNDG